MTPINLADMNKGATYGLFPRAFYEHQNHKGNILSEHCSAFVPEFWFNMSLTVGFFSQFPYHYILWMLKQFTVKNSWINLSREVTELSHPKARNVVELISTENEYTLLA